jgi:hypothetical protein
MPRKKDEKARSLEDMAKELGYAPGEFAIRRLVEARAKVDEWKSYIRVGRVPPDFDGKMDEVQRLLSKLEKDLLAEEHELMPYFHAKKKAIEQDTSISGGLEVKVRRFTK